jgi:hypothetical protein
MNGPIVESVWCDHCQAIRPIRYEDVPGGRLNDHDVTNILCDCGHVVARLHHPRHTDPDDISKRY